MGIVFSYLGAFRRQVDRPSEILDVKIEDSAIDSISDQIMSEAPDFISCATQNVIRRGFIGPRLPLETLKHKSSVVVIDTMPNTSFWHAIVLGALHAVGGKKSLLALWAQMRNSKSTVREALAMDFACKVDDIYGGSITSSTWDKVSDYLQLSEYMLIIIKFSGTMDIIYKSANYFQRVICLVALYDEDGQVSYHTVTSITGLMGIDAYCIHCDKRLLGYVLHKCEFTCPSCDGWIDCKTSTLRDCVICKRTLKSDACFERHKRICKYIVSRSKTRRY